MHIAAEDLIDSLRERGVRITRSRRVVCEVIAESHREHLDAARIHELARTEFDANIDRSTVYRTLSLLEDAGMVRHAHIGDSAVYHLADERRHQHLVCRECGATIALPSSDVAGFVAAVREKTGFHIDIEHVALSGLCATCRAERD